MLTVVDVERFAAFGAAALAAHALADAVAHGHRVLT
jgi:hypothetical protein